MRQKIRLDTMSDIEEFVEKVSSITEPIFLEDGNGSRVTAKSLMFTTAAKMYWPDLYVTCDRDISGSIIRWII